MPKTLLFGFIAGVACASLFGVGVAQLAQPKLVLAQAENRSEAPTRPADGDADKIGKEPVLYDSLKVPGAEEVESDLSPTAGEDKVLRHVVLFKFKESATEADIKTVTDAFADLKNKIPTIVSFEWGTNVSIEPHAQGFTHCFIATFNNEQDRNDYLPHPDHAAFGKIVGPHLEKVLVVDFWPQG